MEACDCPICGRAEALEQSIVDFWGKEYNCRNCGQFAIIDSSFDVVENLDDCASFLFYRRKLERRNDVAVFGYGDNYIKAREQQTGVFSCFKIDNDLIRASAPKDFSEKIDRILLYFAKQSRFQGDFVTIEEEEKSSLFFVRQRFEETGIDIAAVKAAQIKFISNYLRDNKLITPASNLASARMEIAGWSRVDGLQKNTDKNSRIAFVAMKFCKENDGLREAIKNGIIGAGYMPKIMDEHEHNNQIVPEMLYLIRKSKFVVVDESDSNLGAYYEAGYAAGFGKPVIHICNCEVFDKKVHFDVKQVNTIMWENGKLDEFVDKLKKRIKATID